MEKNINDELQNYELATICGSLVVGFTFALAFTSIIPLRTIVLGLAGLIGLAGVALLTVAKYKLLKR